MTVDFSNVWAIARKDLSIVAKKRQVTSSILIWPLVFSVLLPLVTYFLVTRGRVLSALEGIMDAFTLIWIFAPLAFEGYIAGYTFVGEKVEKTMEPLIATPVTDGEILLGKMLVAIIPVYVAVYVAITIFMLLMNLATASVIQPPYFPDGILEGVALVDLVAIIFGAEFSVIVSSRVSGIFSAQIISATAAIPFILFYVLSLLSAEGSIKIITLDFNTLLIIAGIFLAIDVIFFFVVISLFQREKLVSKGK